MVDGRSAYVGRFAPSPTGELHWGSLYTAAASFLDARVCDGAWRLRIDDIDRARTITGTAPRILACLEQLGFEWDGEVAYESQRLDSYREALSELKRSGRIYRCACSRRNLRDESRYPGTCGSRAVNAATDAAWRFRAPRELVSFKDRVQGEFEQDVSATTGDFLVERRDGIPSYVLCVVIDDALDGVTHVVRGADLLEHTPRQILLQRCLALPAPSYAHVPVLTEADGSKLAKSRRSIPVAAIRPGTVLHWIFARLGLAPDPAMNTASAAACWSWARDHWTMERVPRRLALPCTKEAPSA